MREKSGGGSEERIIAVVALALHHTQKARPFEVAALGLHPSFPDVDDAFLQDEGLALAVAGRAEGAFGEEFEDGGRDTGSFEMETGRVQALGDRVESAGDHVGGEHVGGVGVRIAEEVGEGDGGEGVVVGCVGGIKFDHCWGG